MHHEGFNLLCDDGACAARFSVLFAVVSRGPLFALITLAERH